MKEYKLKINGKEYSIAISDVQDTSAKVEVNGTPYEVEFEKPVVKPAVIRKPVVAAAPAAPAAAASPAAANGSAVTSPLPGVIIDVCVKVGDSVKTGDKVAVLEAMKMENVIEATADGTISSINVNKGDSVLEGATLVVIG